MPVTADQGEAARSLDPGAWLGFDDVELGAGQFACTARVANDGSTPGAIELRLDDPLHGELLARFGVVPTGARHSWMDVRSAVPNLRAAGTLYVVFSAGGLGLESLTFDPISSDLELPE